MEWKKKNAQRLFISSIHLCFIHTHILLVILVRLGHSISIFVLLKILYIANYYLDSELKHFSLVILLKGNLRIRRNTSNSVVKHEFVSLV